MYFLLTCCCFLSLPLSRVSQHNHVKIKMNIHSAECLRGELRCLRANVKTLCGQMLAIPPTTSTEKAPSFTDDDPKKSTEEKHEKALQHFPGDVSVASPLTEATQSGTPSAVALPREHLQLEVQVQSQFQLLWAVFQSHSTAEDEVIWPALKEKARSSGGKVGGFVTNSGCWQGR